MHPQNNPIKYYLPTYDSQLWKQYYKPNLEKIISNPSYIEQYIFENIKNIHFSQNIDVSNLSDFLLQQKIFSPFIIQ